MLFRLAWDGQRADAGRLTKGSSLNGATDYRDLWRAHLSFCSSRMADQADDGVVVGEDADDLGAALTRR